LPLPINNLDEWSYRDLLKEGIDMLPSIAPEWTNYNASDPGITLLELFAYFTEMLVFQTGQLTKRDLKAFLFLLNGATIDSGDSRDINRAISESVFQIRQPSRAVTCADFELFAHNADPRVARAKALPRMNLAEHNQEARNAVRPGHLSVVILPHGRPDFREVEEIISRVAAYLDPRRLLTTRVHVVPPRYIEFEIHLKVAAVPGVAADVAADEASAELQRFFDPMRGGQEEIGWVFGRDVFISEIYQVVSKLPTTNHVTRDIDPHTGRELEELTAGGVGVERIRRNQDGELVSFRLAPDELPGSVEIYITGDSTAVDRKREV
jgi:hypothetical protein